MSSIDLTHVLGNLSQSLIPLESFIAGLGYVLGILFMITGLLKFAKLGPHSQEKTFVPFVFVLGGAALLYLPSTLTVLSNTFFGSNNVLQYIEYNPYDVNHSMGILIQTAGLIWFVRGTVLLVHAAEPGEQHGPKGLMFVMAGIFAMNFDYTIDALNAALMYLMSLTAAIVR